MAQITVERLLKGKMLEALISSDYYTDPETATDNGIVKMELLAVDEVNVGNYITHGVAQEIEWYQNDWEFVETSSTDPSGGTSKTDTNITTTRPSESATEYAIGTTVYYNNGEASPTYYTFEVVRGAFIKQSTALVFDVDAGVTIAGFQLTLFTKESETRTEATCLRYTFSETSFVYNNAGTMTINDVMLSLD